VDVVQDVSALRGDRVGLDDTAAYVIRQVGPDTVIELTDARLILRNVRGADLPSGWMATAEVVRWSTGWSASGKVGDGCVA
jgi:hypothetical protein